MPDTFYTFRFGHVGFVMIDTNSILWNNTDNGDQRAWFRDAVATLRAEGATRIVLAGHHTYRSNGRHGNAGSYESIVVGGVDIPNPLPILNGGNVRDFFDDYVCGEVDVYFAGHDHNRQWLNEPGAPARRAHRERCRSEDHRLRDDGERMALGRRLDRRFLTSASAATRCTAAR
jgi:hypothetical protein